MTMKLRRHIAFLAVLAASMVMFVHAVVPHHHRASDLSVCTEAPVSCHHAVDFSVSCDAQVLFDADCDCNCTGVKCAAPLPFTLRCGAEGDDLTSSVSEGLLPLFVCDLCTGGGHLPEPAFAVLSGAVSYFIADARLISQWTPGSVPGRAPPVL